MGLNLDKRQRAMLREMGIRVWQPAPAAVGSAAQGAQPQAPAAHPVDGEGAPQRAINSIAISPIQTSASGQFGLKTEPQALAGGTHKHRESRQALVAPASPARPAPHAPPQAYQAEPANAQANAAPSATPHTMTQASAWLVGAPQRLYPPTGSDAEPARQGARWLVVAEVNPAALDAAMAAAQSPEPVDGGDAFDPFSGDAGRLLDNMLRAARLHQAASAYVVPLARRPGLVSSGAPAAASEVAALLQPLVGAANADIVLVMGRLAAQAALQSDAPLGKLRGQAHTLGGVPAVVTFDAGYVLRNPLDKAKVWDDLRLAMRLAARQSV